MQNAEFWKHIEQLEDELPSNLAPTMRDIEDEIYSVSSKHSLPEQLDKEIIKMDKKGYNFLGYHGTS